jgi:RHS repeat-associated protein
MRLEGIERGEKAIVLRYDRAGLLLDSVMDAAGNVLSIERTDGRIARLVCAPRLGAGAIELARYRYEAGRLVEMRDGYGHSLHYDYDPDGRLTKRRDRRGYSFSFRYDGQGRCVHSAAEDGLYEVSLAYAPLERRTRVTRGGGDWLYEYDDSLTVTSVVDPIGATRRFLKRPSDGRIATEIDASGRAFAYAYDEDGRFVGKKDALGRWVRGSRPHRTPQTALEYDWGLLQEKEFTLPTAEDLAWAVPSEVATRLATATDETRGVCVVARDIQGLLLREARDGRTRRYAYDAGGNLRWDIDFDGARTDYEVASLNQRVAIRDPNGLTTRFEYTREDELGAVVDGGGARCDFQWGARDEVTVVARGGAARDLYVRDASGRLVEKRDGQGRPLYTLKRGPQGEVVERTFAGGGFERLTYDEDLRLVRGETTEGVVELAYAGGDRVRDLRDGRGVARRFLGRDLHELTVLERFESRYRYLNSSRGRTVRVKDPTGRVHTLRALGSGAVERSLAHGVSEIAQYHPAGWCLRKLVRSDKGETLWARSFEWSGEGDLLAAHDSLRGTTRYSYDAGHRLVAEETSAEVRLFRHDDGGNLVRHGSGYACFARGNFLVDANGRRFEHDVRQAVTLERTSNGARQFRRDERDQLVAVERYDVAGVAPDGAPQLRFMGHWSATYDVLGRRTSKTAGADRTVFYWDTDRLAAEIAPSGALRVYVYADALAMTPVLFVDYESADADPASGAVYAVFANHLGCPERVMGPRGEWVWSARIEPYGRAHVEAGAGFHQPLRWPGHYYDAELDLHANRFRTYSPELGRYLEPDPMGRGGGDENVYAYAAGNPLRTVDTRGLSVCPIPEKRRRGTEGKRGPTRRPSSGRKRKRRRGRGSRTGTSCRRGRRRSCTRMARIGRCITLTR